MASFVLIKMWLFVFILMLVSNSKPFARGVPQVPCYFVFGDSLSDPGNNNFLATVAKANYPPYGKDFPLGIATGRFCNGRNIADVIAELLGFLEFIPPYVGVQNNVLEGVNYASGSAGIRDESGSIQGQRFNMNDQLSNHKIIVARTAFLLGSSIAASNHLNKCIYSITIGNNDYLNNYFLPAFYPTSSLYTPEQFATVLVQQYSTQLETLYNLGARKVVLIGLGPIGFAPYELASHAVVPPTPVDINNAAQLFNVKLKALVAYLNLNLLGAKFTFIDSFAISTTPTLTSPIYKVTNAPCCKIEENNYTCQPNSIPCLDTNEFTFFDSIHPTERANNYLGSVYYNAPLPIFACPYDISHLVNLI